MRLSRRRAAASASASTPTPTSASAVHTPTGPHPHPHTHPHLYAGHHPEHALTARRLDALALRLLARMTPAEKAGQLLLPIIFPTNAAGLTLTPDLAALLDDCHLGGYFITAAGADAGHVRAFTAALQARARIPLILATDFEGGSWNFLASAAGPRPSAATIGATADPEAARAKGITDAVRLTHLGLNVNFAPVVDVLTNPSNPIVADRVFGATPDLVTRMAAAYLEGLASTGVAGCLKHFPGLGHASADPHHTLPTVERTLADLRAVELAPYRDLIQSGHAHSIMTTHMRIPALDPDLPTSLSPIAISGILRRELGYGGLVMSDSLVMGALSARYSIPDASLLALAAGTDVLLGAPDIASTRATHALLLAALASGRLSTSRLDASVRRVLRFKLQWGILPLAAAEAATAVSRRAARRPRAPAAPLPAAALLPI